MVGTTKQKYTDAVKEMRRESESVVSALCTIDKRTVRASNAFSVNMCASVVFVFLRDASYFRFTYLLEQHTTHARERKGERDLPRWEQKGENSTLATPQE